MTEQTIRPRLSERPTNVFSIPPTWFEVHNIMMRKGFTVGRTACLQGAGALPAHSVKVEPLRANRCEWSHPHD